MEDMELAREWDLVSSYEDALETWGRRRMFVTSDIWTLEMIARRVCCSS